MKYTRKNTSPTLAVFTVTLDADDLAKTKKSTVARLSKKIKVAGFRQGKVPAAVAEKQLDQNMLGMEVAEDAVNSFMVDVLETEKLQPLDRPKVDLTAYVPNESLEFKADVEILPAITLGDYKKLKGAKQAANVEDKDVDDVIERMRQGMSQKEETDQAAQNGDEVIIDFKGTDKDGKDVAGATGKEYPLTLGSNSFIPGFEEGLVGKKAGEHLDLPLTFPKDYHHKPLAGAKVTFAVDVKKVNQVKLPELNDDFAAQAGPFKTVDDLKADIRRELTDQHEREALDKLRDELIEQLIKGSDIPTPEILINDQMESLKRDFIQNLLYRGMTLEQYLEQQGKTEEEWAGSELREQAIRRVQVGLALAELSKLEKIDVTREELEERLREMLQRYGGDKQFREQLDTPEARRDLANRLITEKTVDRLVELNSKSAKK
jgi:trigger factor